MHLLLAVAVFAQDPYPSEVRPLVEKYCLACHSTKAKKGSLDLERFASTADLRRNLKTWQQVLEMLEAGEMPPKEKLQPGGDQRKRWVAWVRGFLDAEARARAGDPGFVPLRRLSNAEYDLTIRELTGVDLRPTREFPADGAASEGFTNAAEALSDVSPALLTKYLNAAKDSADHAVLLPDGFRFSPGKSRRDWTDESLARLRQFFAGYTPDGKVPLQRTLAATIRRRDGLPFDLVNPKYFDALWQALTDPAPSQPLDAIRTRWRTATEKDAPALAAEIAAWQAALWKVVPVGSYRNGNTTRQVANDPALSQAHVVRLAVKPAPGQNEVTLHLVAQGGDGPVAWGRPRLERAGKPALLLRDYAQFGPAYEVDLRKAFADTSKYLAAAADVSKKHDLDAALLQRWSQVLGLGPERDAPGRDVPMVPFELLDEKATGSKPAINGWRKKGSDLPSLLTNSSDAVERIPGNAAPRSVVVHPTPQDFVAVAWKSPVSGSVRVTARVTHAHPACGNGVAWWLEHRGADRATVLSEGAVNVGGEAKPPVRTVTVEKGEFILLAVDARDGSHVCDLTDIALNIAGPDRAWDLAADIAGNVLDGNPHADRHGNPDVWSFVRGPSRPVKGSAGPLIAAGSVLDRWRQGSADRAKLADQAQALLSGPRPAKEKDPDRVLYDNLVSVDSVLLQGLDLSRFRAPDPGFALPPERFDAEGGLAAEANSATPLRLPAALFRDREFVVEGRIDGGDRVVQFQVLTAPPGPVIRWDGKSPAVGTAAAHQRQLQGYADFRRVFPLFLCFPRILPDDEVVCLKMYHREDEPLARLFLDDEARARLDHLWKEHRFISRQPIAENDYLPQFIGFVTQDQPKELLAYFEGQRGPFRKRAEEFERELEAAVPKQLEALVEFAARAYRRPLTDREPSDLRGHYQALRDKGVGHEEAFRGVLTRVLVSPAFLFRIERAPAGREAGPVSGWELATRLSYFLWSSPPDEELRRAADRLREPAVLEAQARRMLRDGRVRAAAIEFGTQWIHVRGFDELKEKNERLFPTFDAALREAIYEESILFFQDLFQNDRAVTQILEADYAFLNERLAGHYGIPGVKGAEWRRVDGVRKYGRGGILGFASVQAKESGASRTSPVLRGNWLVETLLGEKLPRPPPNVPKLPEEEGGADRLTMRQLVERHVSAPECATCHVRIDPFGFALEKYDPIGRLREKDLGGLPVDARAKLKDGTEFEGIDGLRAWLMANKRDGIVRLFCRKLAGYALGRAVTLSDQSLLDEMAASLNQEDGRVSAAVLAIVRSPQFRMIRGSAFSDDE